MGYLITKSKTQINDFDSNTEVSENSSCPNCKTNRKRFDNFDNAEESKYFNVRIKKKDYPSCYQYNVLVMLAKRLLREEQELKS